MMRTDGQPMAGEALSPLLREALDWLVFLKSGKATSEDADALASWRAKSDAHETAFRDAVRMQRGLQALLQAEAEQRVVPLSSRRAGLSRRTLFTGGGAIAASLAGAWVATHPPLDLWPSYSELTADYRTTTGQRRTLAPAAGVDIEMNTRTSITRGTDASSLELVAGEAFISVGHPEGFTLTSANARIVATDAAFNVRHLEAETCVTCLKGVLDIRRQGRQIRLTPGQQMTYTPRDMGPVAVAGQTSDATSWREGLLIFRGETLNRVVEEINRYQAGRILLTDKALGRNPVNAVFHLDQIHNAATQIAQLLDVKATSLPGGIVLIG